MKNKKVNSRANVEESSNEHIHFPILNSFRMLQNLGLNIIKRKGLMKSCIITSKKGSFVLK